MKNTNFKSTHKQNKERHLQQYTGSASQLLQLCSAPPQTCFYSVLHGYNRPLTHRGLFLLLATGSQHHYHWEENRFSVARSISASSLTLVSLGWGILDQQTPQLLEKEQIAEPTDTFKWEKAGMFRISRLNFGLNSKYHSVNANWMPDCTHIHFPAAAFSLLIHYRGKHYTIRFHTSGFTCDKMHIESYRPLQQWWSFVTLFFSWARSNSSVQQVTYAIRWNELSFM